MNEPPRNPVVPRRFIDTGLPGDDGLVLRFRDLRVEAVGKDGFFNRVEGTMRCIPGKDGE